MKKFLLLLPFFITFAILPFSEEVSADSFQSYTYKPGDYYPVGEMNYSEDSIGYYIDETTHSAILVWDGSHTVITVPDYVKNNYPVVGIASNAFYQNSLIKEITLGNNVRFIDSYAFFEASSLRKVVLNDGLYFVGDYVFVDNAIEYFQIQNQIGRLGYMSFNLNNHANADHLRAIFVPESEFSLYSSFFYNQLTSQEPAGYIVTYKDNAVIETNVGIVPSEAELTSFLISIIEANVVDHFSVQVENLDVSTVGQHSTKYNIINQYGQVVASSTLIINVVDSAVAKTTATITFNSNGGSAVESQVIKLNEKITQPANPTKENYEFLGWYSDENLLNPYDFNTLVNSDITLYARWKKINPLDNNDQNNNKISDPAKYDLTSLSNLGQSSPKYTLPKTGETNHSEFIILGFGLVFSMLLIKKISKENSN